MSAPLKVLVVPSLLANRPSAYLTHLETAGLEVLRSPLGRPYGEAELIEGLLEMSSNAPGWLLGPMSWRGVDHASGASRRTTRRAFSS